MMRSTRLAAAFLIASLASMHAVFAQDKAPQDKRPDKTAADNPAPPPAKFVRQHQLNMGGKDVGYTTTAEEIYLKDADGKNTASFFTISYTKDGVSRPEDRPLTFVFNGGPGSASVFLHLGVIGPKVIDIPSDASDPGGPPYRLRDNPSTILRATDLVFIDPVGTGFSHPMGEKKNEEFWGFDEDADSVAEFIRTFVTEHNRWNSPKYILGESYGGIRTALLLPRLQQKLNVGVNGVVLISPALNLLTLPFVTGGNDLTYATTLPALASVALYHHRLPDQWKDTGTLLREVESFAGGEYLAALFKGDGLDKAEKQRLAEKLHRYTGLSTEYILRSDLRIYMARFAKELLRDEGKSVGLLDGRYTQKELDKVADRPGSDAFDVKTGPIYVSTFQSYLRNDLGVDLSRRYVPQNEDAEEKWARPKNARNAFAGFIDATDALAQATKDNEALRVFAAAGYHDLVTSYFAMNYMLRHSGIDPARLTVKDYNGGHMMYLHQPSREALSNDIVAFIEEGKR